jgi:malonyl CoA-acyl carrier protein transacylase
MKLVRNNLIDHGISTNAEEIISELLWELVQNQKGELKIVHKINESHLLVSGTQRQKVKTAVQLISRTVGNALEFFGEAGQLKSRGWRNTAKFILMMD